MQVTFKINAVETVQAVVRTHPHETVCVLADSVGKSTIDFFLIQTGVLHPRPQRQRAGHNEQEENQHDMNSPFHGYTFLTGKFIYFAEEHGTSGLQNPQM
jgi:hypothetical protein